MAFQRVAQLSEIPDGGGLCVKIGDLAIGVFNDAGTLYALENACPHSGYPLSEGGIRSGIVVCPLHGWDFDARTGHRPGFEDGWPIPCFAVKVEGDEVYLDPDTPINLPRRRAAR